CPCDRRFVLPSQRLSWLHQALCAGLRISDQAASTSAAIINGWKFPLVSPLLREKLMRHGWIENKTEPHASVAIVEDERVSRKALTALLSDQGYETTAFASAEEMLDWIDHELPKVLLVDV